MRALIRRLDARMSAIYHFWQNFVFYLRRGHWPRKAWEMAANTLS